MTTTRRDFIAITAAAGAVTLLPFATRAATAAYRFDTGSGPLTVHPVHHVSMAIETPGGVLYSDPVGDASAYAGLPPADFITVTHEHGDHFNVDTLHALTREKTRLLTNPRVHGMLPADLASRAVAAGNGDTAEVLGMKLDAIPAYNTTPGRTKFHPQGRDNGYVFTLGDLRLYISGDTEDIPEMRALKNIDLAFVCMNLPFTMDVNQAASAIAEFRPKVVFPFHYRGQNGGTQDPAELAKLLAGKVDVRQHDWYNGELS